MVCMGNICRSPTAEGVLRTKLQHAGLDGAVKVDSAGTHGEWHRGEPPDRRAQAAAKLRGYDLSRLRARSVATDDFERFDLLLAMDQDNLSELHRRADPTQRHKLRRLGDYSLRGGHPDVPDPYYGSPAGFERVLDLVEDACDGLLDDLRQQIHGRQQGTS